MQCPYSIKSARTHCIIQGAIWNILQPFFKVIRILLEIVIVRLRHNYTLNAEVCFGTPHSLLRPDLEGLVVISG